MKNSDIKSVNQNEKLNSKGSKIKKLDEESETRLVMSQEQN